VEPEHMNLKPGLSTYFLYHYVPEGKRGGIMRENILMAVAIIVFSCVPVVQLIGGF
jgi:hypothetical protein